MFTDSPSALGFVPLSLVCWDFKKRELAQFACYANVPDMLLWAWRLEFYHMACAKMN